MKKLKVVYMGTPNFSVPALDALIKNTNVIMVVTSPDAYVGRKKVLTECEVKKFAKENNIETFSPINIKKEYQKITDLKPDIIITCAYGQIIPKELLEAPKYGCINIHASLLPKYRGGAPIHHAIINDESKTGITIMYMDEGMDTGDIIVKEEMQIIEEDNIETLSNKLSILGSKMIIDVLPKVINKTITRIKQNNKEASYAPIIKREHELLDFKNKTAREIFNQVRALSPSPLAYFKIDNKDYKVEECEIISQAGKINTVVKADKENLVIMAKDKGVSILKIKPVGKNTMTIKDFFNGNDPNNFIKKEVNKNEKSI